MKRAAKTKRPYTRLDMASANEIRRQYWVHQVPQAIIAKRFKADQSTISYIVNFKSWMK